MSFVTSSLCCYLQVLAVTVLLSYVTRCCQVWPFEKRVIRKYYHWIDDFCMRLCILLFMTSSCQEWPAYGNICVESCHWMLPGVVRCDQMLPAVTRSGFISKKKSKITFLSISQAKLVLFGWKLVKTIGTPALFMKQKMVALRCKVKFLRPKMSKTFREPQLRGLLSYRAEIWRADSLGTNLDIINIPTFS